MADWRSDYLAEAGVPRWVRRDLPVEMVEETSTATNQKPSVKEIQNEEVQSEEASQSQVQAATSVCGLSEHSNPAFIMVLPAGTDWAQVQPVWRQLQKAWQSWTGVEFAASCYKLEQGAPTQLEDLADKAQKVVLAGVSLSIDKSIAAEALSFDSAINKRQWWSTLQVLAQSIRH